MSTGTKIPLAAADRIAHALVEELAPACERIKVAGSVLRRKPLVGDIEIVCEPRMVEAPRVDLFAPAPMVSALDTVLAALLAAGRLVHHPVKPPADGDRYKRRWATKAGVQVDLFIVRPPAQFWVLFAIRTGPAE